MKRFLERIQYWVNTIPETIAVCDENRSYSWKEYDELAGKVYAYLKDKHLGVDDFVGIQLPRCAEIIICQEGILRNGSAFVCLEEDSLSPERTDFIKKDCNCKFIIDESVLKEMQSYRFESGYNESASEHDLALAIYTSGSSGNPKGALHERGDADICMDFEESENFPLKEGNTLPLLAPLNMAVCVIAFFERFSVGGTLVVTPLPVVKDPTLLRQFFKQYNVSEPPISPGLVPFVADLPSVKRVLVVGERWDNVYNSDKLFNVYASSECIFLLGTFHLAKNEKPSIGVPKAEYNVQVLDEWGKPVPKGEIGELCYYNPYFRGYIHEEKLTQKCFWPGKIYRSHDAVRWTSEGKLEVVGRLDDMVKICGNRVEPGEIEAVFKKMFGIKNVVVKAFEVGPSLSLVLYYEKGFKVLPPIREIKRRLQEILPDYMVPCCFVAQDVFPTLPNGKLNRRALEKPDFLMLRPVYVAPQTEIQQDVCRAFEKALNVEKIGLEDSFESLGGDSISMAELLVRLDKYSPSLQDMQAGFTAGSLAEALAKKRGAISSSEEMPAAQANEPLDLFAMQQDMLETEQENLQNGYILIPVTIVLPQDVDLDRLAKALDSAIQAHPALLFVYTKSGGEYKQCFRPDLFQSTEIRFCEESNFPEYEEKFFRPFELFETLQYRIEIVRTEKTSRMMFCVNHANVDGTSIDLFMKDVEQIYFGERITKDYYRELVKNFSSEEKRKFIAQVQKEHKEKNARIFKNFCTTPKPDFDGFLGLSRVVPEREIVQVLEQPTEFYALSYLLALAEYNGCEKVALIVTLSGKSDARSKTSCGNFLMDSMYALDIHGKTERELFEELTASMQKEERGPYCSVVEYGGALIYQSNLGMATFLGQNVIETYSRFGYEKAENMLDINVVKVENRNMLFAEYDSAIYGQESIEKFCNLMVEKAAHLKKVLFDA